MWIGGESLGVIIVSYRFGWVVVIRFLFCNYVCSTNFVCWVGSVMGYLGFGDCFMLLVIWICFIDCLYFITLVGME